MYTFLPKVEGEKILTNCTIWLYIILLIIMLYSLQTHDVSDLFVAGIVVANVVSFFFSRSWL